ncbi:hypothetical protein B0J14DRAFT_555033 [Halenospora varia]|nr:hypothetical protein B0J14DRAFT_555033 [Halenospora varia]
MGSNDHHEILLLVDDCSLSLFHSRYENFVSDLTKTRPIRGMTIPDSALKYLSKHTPKAILVPGDCLTLPAYLDVLDIVRDGYIRHGGVLVTGLLLAESPDVTLFEKFFRINFTIPWKLGSCCWTTYTLNRLWKLLDPVTPLTFPALFTMQSFNVKNVDGTHKIFIPSPQPDSPQWLEVGLTEAAVVGAKFHDSWVYYVGLTDGNMVTRALILGLCRS